MPRLTNYATSFMFKMSKGLVELIPSNLFLEGNPKVKLISKQEEQNVCSDTFQGESVSH